MPLRYRVGHYRILYTVMLETQMSFVCEIKITYLINYLFIYLLLLPHLRANLAHSDAIVFSGVSLCVSLCLCVWQSAQNSKNC